MLAEKHLPWKQPYLLPYINKSSWQSKRNNNDKGMQILVAPKAIKHNGYLNTCQVTALCFSDSYYYSVMNINPISTYRMAIFDSFRFLAYFHNLKKGQLAYCLTKLLLPKREIIKYTLPLKKLYIKNIKIAFQR